MILILFLNDNELENDKTKTEFQRLQENNGREEKNRHMKALKLVEKKHVDDLFVHILSKHNIRTIFK